MANTGYKQAVVAYKVSRPGGEPVDINGELISVSGNKQAIAVLEGQSNPDPALYIIEFTYTADGIVTGNPTVEYNAADCPVGFITVTPSQIVLTPAAPSGIITLKSSQNWVTDSSPAGINTISMSSGPAGTFLITLTRTETVGQGDYVFRNTTTGQTATLHVVNVLSEDWILLTGTWNMLGFWYDNGIWNY